MDYADRAFFASSATDADRVLPDDSERDGRFGEIGAK